MSKRTKKRTAKTLSAQPQPQGMATRGQLFELYRLLVERMAEALNRPTVRASTMQVVLMLLKDAGIVSDVRDAATARRELTRLKEDIGSASDDLALPFPSPKLQQ